MKEFTVIARIPALVAHRAYQSVTVEASSWEAAIGRAARELKSRPEVKGRRIHELTLSITETDRSRKREVSS